VQSDWQTAFGPLEKHVLENVDTPPEMLVFIDASVNTTPAHSLPARWIFLHDD